LSARYRIGNATVDPQDVATLKSYLGDDADGLPDDLIACAVIEQELKKLRASRASA
jgi:hypothetical protein